MTRRTDTVAVLGAATALLVAGSFVSSRGPAPVGEDDVAPSRPPATVRASTAGQDVTAPRPAADDQGAALVATLRERARDADRRTGDVRAPVTDVVETESRTTPEGFHLAPGTGPVVGSDGPVVTWTAEVDPATGRAVDAVLPVLAAALDDPARGWTARGERRLQRIDDPATADVRVVLATPAVVDRFCAVQGLDTAGIFSCWDGRRAMLNLGRWDEGAPGFDDVGTYRTYLVNHEVGHGLGHDHVDCPAAGQSAPIMLQQTRSTRDCRPNGWPYPDGAAG